MSRPLTQAGRRKTDVIPATLMPGTALCPWWWGGVRWGAYAGWTTQVDMRWAHGYWGQVPLLKGPWPADCCCPLPAVKWRTVTGNRGWDGAMAPGESGLSQKSPWPGRVEKLRPAWVWAFREHHALPPPESYFCSFLASFLSLRPHLRLGET